MSGHGKGEKGQGKGGTKRHRRVLWDNIQGISKPNIQCLAVEGVPSTFPNSSMRRSAQSSRFSLRMSSVMPSPTLSMLRGRPSPPWMSSMLLKDNNVLSIVSKDKS
ncbi:unnamed protein product [Staurois parvus]|uniref:Histone H4 n=1 Tax=Staurois parvus TaxID=386267 RepID=A0ABN9B1L7_9NEOB|nr:unnamed protein product [Staurois parvus]